MGTMNEGLNALYRDTKRGNNHHNARRRIGCGIKPIRVVVINRGTRIKRASRPNSVVLATRRPMTRRGRRRHTSAGIRRIFRGSVTNILNSNGTNLCRDGTTLRGRSRRYTSRGPRTRRLTIRHFRSYFGPRGVLLFVGGDLGVRVGGRHSGASIQTLRYTGRYQRHTGNPTPTGSQPYRGAIPAMERNGVGAMPYAYQSPAREP